MRNKDSIKKSELLEWLKAWRDGDDLKDFRSAVGMVVEEIESGVFDHVKEEDLCYDCGVAEKNSGLDVCGDCYDKRIWGSRD